MSYVSPIVEESETRSDTIRSHHGSFASSMVIPENSDDYYLRDDDMETDDDDTITSDYGRNSRGSDHDDRRELVQPALVRQASLGRRTKPSIMTIRSSENLGEKKASLKRKPIPEVGTGASAAGIGSAMLAARDGISGRDLDGPVRGNAVLNSSSNESLDSLKRARAQTGDSNSQRALDPEKAMLEMMDAPAHPLQQGTRQSTLAERVGKRRPPRLDVDAVREAEARGSLTSLPELIRRATRLAANLDRGKTASRPNTVLWENGALEKGKPDTRRSGSLSDMLGAFPPPGEGTPTGNRTPRPNRGSRSKWPLSADRGDSAMTDRKSNKRRRCCGLPLWTFVTLLIVLLFLIAAAVVIPIVLIVIPRMKDTQNVPQNNSAVNTGTATPSNDSPPVAVPTTGANNQCSGIITCQNNGVAVMNADRTCNCVCINGFTGRTCSTQADAGCTTADIAGTSNATVGTGIPRLIEKATDFGLPLNSSSLLALFSNLSLTCTSENALITFNGLASRSIPEPHAPVLVETIVRPSRTLPLFHQSHLDRIDKRQTIGEPGIAQPNRAANAAASATSEAQAKPSLPVSSNVTAVDFARIGVLMAFQETRNFDTAVRAQESIQNFLSVNRNGNSNSNEIDLGPFTIDLVKLLVEYKNGTTIQANTTSESQAL